MKRLILLFSVSVLLTVQHLEAQTAVTDTVFLQRRTPIAKAAH